MKLLTIRWMVGVFSLAIVGYFAGYSGDPSTLLTLAGIISVAMIPTPFEIKRSLQ